MISVRNLAISRGQRQLASEISFDVEGGSLHVIAGPNGSGKSTLLAALAGDLLIDSGEIFLDGGSLSTLSDADQARKRAVLLQRPVLFPFTARQLLTLVDEQRAKLGLLAPKAQIDLGALIDKRITHLSGGEVARVMLAATLAQGAKVLLLDEPTAAFDRRYRDIFLDWLAQWREHGYAIVVVTHDEKVESLANSLTILD